MKHLTAAEARDLGVLLEVNRRGLHPRGLALQCEIATDGDIIHTVTMTGRGIDDLLRLIEWMRGRVAEATPAADEDGKIPWDEWLTALAARVTDAKAQPDAAVLRIQDHRDDPEGVYYADLDEADCAKASAFDRLLVDRIAERRLELGFVEQPLPDQVLGGYSGGVLPAGAEIV